MSDEINIKPKSKKFKLFILLAVLVIASLTIAAVVLGVTKTAIAKKVDKQLSLGEKYLSKLEYEQAIAAYEKALKIDPKNTDAYLGLADVYLAMGDYDKAEEILGEAKEVIKKAEDKDRIKRKEKKVTKEKETEPKTPPSPTPTPTKVPTKAPSSGKVEALKKASVGDYITFGTYEQDNNLSNDAEPIEWLVLEKKDGKALVLSKYALDAKPYNEEDVDVTWETCTLRSWLNNEFYTTAFNKTERSAVVETLIKNKDNPDYGTEGGNDTKDKVFLLSIEEVTTYFDSDPDAEDPARRAQMTEYAIAQGGYYYTIDKYYNNGWWWLRSPGLDGSFAAVVDSFGYVNRNGGSVGYDRNPGVVRPALWIAYAEQESTPTETPSSGKVEALKKASAGDYITFGTYEQDNNLSNGAEPIEWLVLEKKDGKALVLSKYALDCKPYNEEYVEVTWETCTLRSWLNEEFYTTAFNKTERSAVVQTLIKNEDNPRYGTEGGNDTKDKVFLLSIEEVTTYFDPDPDAYDPARRAKVTEYAVAQGGWYYDDKDSEYYGNGCWWLRSPGVDSERAADVDFLGDVYRSGDLVGRIDNVVRPALWLAY